MKKCTILVAILFCIFSAYSQTPQTISWQGILQDADAKNLSGTYSLTVKLFDVASGGAALWSELHSNRVIADGLVELSLGSITPFGLDFDKQLWLEITVGSGTPLPRIKLSSVPYALHSKTAESANETDPTWNNGGNQSSNIGRAGNVGIGTSSPNALLHIMDTETIAGDVLFVGNINWTSPRNPPISGTGTRMMWYPDKAALRSGHVAGNHWDKHNIGVSSVAMGYNTIASNEMATAFGTGTEASGYASTAFGGSTEASGNVATAFGSNTVASGTIATATGSNTTASGNYSFSMGYETNAFGDYSLAMGKNTTAYSGFEVVLGSFSTEYVPVNAFGWSGNDRLFVIGNGIGDWAPSNAMTVLKNGKVGIGTENPQYQLHVNSPGIFTGIHMTTDAAGTTMSDGLIIGMQYQANEPVNQYATILNQENSPLILGTNNNFQGDMTIHPGGNIGIGLGINPPTARLDVNGQVRIRGGSPGVGKVLTSDANGVAAWQATSIPLPYSGSLSYPNQSVFTITNLATNGYSAIQGYAMGNTTGLAGLADQGTGVLGYSYAGKGVHGYVQTGDSPIAIYGQNESILGNPIAVKGQVAVTNGYSGHFNGGRFYISGNTGIGTLNPTALLHTSGTGAGQGNVVFVGESKVSPGDPPVSGTGTRMMWYPDKAAFRAGQVLSWDPAVWDKANIGNSSTAMGFGTTASGISSTALGNQTVASGESSTTMGASTKASGYASTAMGLFTTASGYCSVALGEQTTASGENSIAVGYKSKASGYASTALGESTTASGILSTAMGFNSIASANFSTAIGSSTTASGAYSTAMGMNTTASSYASLSIGRYNVGVGNATTWVSTDPLFEIGNGTSSASKSNAMTVLKNGRVGIGTSSPGAGLHLKSSGFPSSFMFLESNSGQDAGFRIYEGSTDKWHIFNNSALAGLHIYNTDGETTIFAKQSNAFIGLGINSPTQRLDVNGNARFRSIGSGAYSGVVNRTSDGTLTTATSDIRFKENISTLENSLDRVMQLRGVSFTWKSNPEYGTRIGFVAQEFEKVVPELSFVNPADGYMGINYAEMTAVLVEAMKEQQAIIDEQKTINEEQNKRINELEKKIEILFQQVSK
jgi:hypothetical protein